MKLSDIISVSTQVQNHRLVFTGTNIPIESLFICIKQGGTVSRYLEYFPSVSREKALALLAEIES